ncbi:hypothetical protein HHL16_12300 [Pseudoflavitalea sp. G-6-1-2]|uniref:contractile injection system tape measure protein n=1 Tax=Pseudoflavitalea sp. G-6-1-2 TaxID=2728841 RepID=UPI00146A7804|nr:contractile injection system tape measure protein [Pseudoflavitalea sp. G-6-1-2]NML21663.1 hypothetical protein [Pseudoflavitalea sp. G-6-1-2]
MKHIIKTQVLELTIDQQLDAFDIQHRMSMLYYNELLPALEKIFNAISDGDNDIIIDKLELDLGVLAEKSFTDRDSIRQLISSIEEQLQSAASSKTAQQSSAHVIRRARPISIFRQWIYYMQHGYLPWNATPPDKKWLEQILETVATDYNISEELRQQIRHNAVIAERIALQHDEIFLLHLTEVLTAKKQQQLIAYVNEIAAIIKVAAIPSTQSFAGITEIQLRRRIWKTVLSTISTQAAAVVSTEAIATHIIESIFTPKEAAQLLQSKTVTAKLPLSLPLVSQLAKLPEAKKEAGKQTPSPAPKQEPPAASVPQQKATSNPPSDPLQTGIQINITHNDQPAAANKTISNTDTPALAEQITEEGIFVQHAGIVLLAPFIKPFFNNIGLLNNGKFTDENSTLKAISLLHYLATGRSSSEEYELVIPKLLCGIPLSACIDNHIELNDQETSEAEELLTEAIAQWEILKKTSNAGLRETFLQRPGKLFTRNDRPHLQVEAGPIDMLLDYLPWNISIIKLPWMKEYLQVEWR